MSMCYCGVKRPAYKRRQIRCEELFEWECPQLGKIGLGALSYAFARHQVSSLQKYGTSPYYFLIILTKQEELIRRIFESKLEIF